ncbi:MAG: bifunctional oligoribonuclease/PAP phosphatase NrnA [Anaerolineae bacterium]|nr:bifunctional oligoribonuclease/PAP phosphatase NrnA [Anaerolineae bacterium]
MIKMVAQVAKRIASAQRILAVCHVAPDGDAIGSLLGLGLALVEAGKDVTMLCADPVPESCQHLPGWEKITPTWQTTDLELIVSLDCSDPKRLGQLCDPECPTDIPIINIDHHTTNTYFGQINWVDTNAAATAQMLYALITELDIPIDVAIANCLLNGIVTDTLGFRTSNTTAEVVEIGLQLIKAGASISELSDYAFNHRPISVIKLWAAAMQDMCLEGRILWSQITQALRDRIGYKANGDAGLVSFLCAVDQVDIAVIFDELQDGSINVSMRAVPGYTVSQVALELGGGGHPQAAGCTISGPIEEARTKVLSMLRQAWNKQTPG